MAKMFDGFDLTHFWQDSAYARQNYVSGPVSDDLISSVEAELAFRLPASYVELMKTQNGGIPRNTCFPTKVPTSWAKDHTAISGIFGIGRDAPYSLCGELGSIFMQEKWGYPDIGISICNCPSAGHDMIMLDYRKCGSAGEPEVVHVDEGRGYQITFVAFNFEAFVRGLVNVSVYDTSQEDLKKDLKKIESGSFSTLLARLVSASGKPQSETQIRSVCLKLTKQKGLFALHADELSLLVYDILFCLYTLSNKVTNKDQYLTIYPKLIVSGDGAFRTRGYGPGFIQDWINSRLKENKIIKKSSGELGFSDEYMREFEQKLIDSE